MAHRCQWDASKLSLRTKLASPGSARFGHSALFIEHPPAPPGRPGLGRQQRPCCGRTRQGYLQPRGPKGLPRRGNTHLASPLVLDRALSCVALSNSGSFRVISKISVWGPLISLRGQRLSSVTHALSIWISWIKRSRHRHGRSVQECWPRLSPSPTREMEVQEQILHAPPILFRRAEA